MKLETVLEEYDLAELKVLHSHDGFVICNESDVTLWRWDVEFDGPPHQVLETLFEEVGFDVERM